MSETLPPLIAANWKMNGSAGLLGAFVEALTPVAQAGGMEILLCPPHVLLHQAYAVLAGSHIALGGQDCHAQASGAHTGDISASMLKDAGCHYVIAGHSERRRDHRENSEIVRAKSEAAQAAGLVPVLCIGETLEEREAGKTLDVLEKQLAASLPKSQSAEALVVAYEPVWAIGTGRTASPDDIAEAHAFLARQLRGGVRVLYGGSVNAENAASILATPHVGGVLVGGASLKPQEFAIIARAASGTANNAEVKRHA